METGLDNSKIQQRLKQFISPKLGTLFSSKLRHHRMILILKVVNFEVFMLNSEDKGINKNILLLKQN